MNEEFEPNASEMDANLTEVQDSTATELRPEQLPEPLAVHRIKYLIGVLLTTIIVIISVIIIKDAKTLFFLFIPLYLGYKSLLVQRDWKTGEIQEVTAFCRYVRVGTVQDRVVVSFCTYDEDGNQDQHYQFSVPNKKKAEDFIPESPYLIYFRASEPRNLLAYLQI